MTGLALVAAACTAQRVPDRDVLPPIDSALTTTPPVTVAQADAGRLTGIAGRVLMLGRNREIVIVRPDGSDAVRIADPTPIGIDRSYPAWSPDATQVAWTEEVAEDTYEVVIAEAATGAELSRSSSPVLAQYLAWSPDGRKIAYMGNDFWGEMVLAVSDAGFAASILDMGAPMYVDWSPDSRSLLVHIDQRFQRIDPAGSVLDTIETEGRFRVPAHAGERIVYSVDDAEVGEILAVADPGGGDPLPLIRYTAPAALVTHTPTNRLAIMSTWTREGVEISESTLTDLPILIPEHLTVLDLDDGAVTLVAEKRAVSWSWSPAGDRLLYSTIEFVADAQRIQWHVWDGSTTSFEVFTPTSRFGNGYLTFFDQYERAVSLWSPDGAAFVYAGGAVGGPAGIWVQPVASGPPVLISDGIYAAWSPVDT